MPQFEQRARRWMSCDVLQAREGVNCSCRPLPTARYWRPVIQVLAAGKSKRMFFGVVPAA